MVIPEEVLDDMKRERLEIDTLHDEDWYDTLIYILARVFIFTIRVYLLLVSSSLSSHHSLIVT